MMKISTVSNTDIIIFDDIQGSQEFTVEYFKQKNCLGYFDTEIINKNEGFSLNDALIRARHQMSNLECSKAIVYNGIHQTALLLHNQ